MQLPFKAEGEKQLQKQNIFILHFLFTYVITLASDLLFLHVGPSYNVLSF